MSIGDRIKAIRIRSGIKQTIVANGLGISSSRLSALENSVQNPTIQQLEAISKYFNVSSDFLLFGKESLETINPTEQEILEMLRNDSDAFKAMRELVEMKKKLFSGINQRRYNAVSDSVAHG